MKKQNFLYSGFSIMEVMIAAALLGVVSLGVMQVTKNMMKSSKTDAQRVEYAQVINQIQSLLRDEYSCEATLNGLNPSGGGSDVPVFKRARQDGTTSDVLTAGQAYGTGGTPIFLKKMEIKNFSATSGIAQFVITMNKGRTDFNTMTAAEKATVSATAYGSPTFAQILKVQVILDTSGKIKDCISDKDDYTSGACGMIDGDWSDKVKCKSINISANATEPAITSEGYMAAKNGLTVGSGLATNPGDGSINIADKATIANDTTITSGKLIFNDGDVRLNPVATGHLYLETKTGAGTADLTVGPSTGNRTVISPDRISVNTTGTAPSTSGGSTPGACSTHTSQGSCTGAGCTWASGSTPPPCSSYPDFQCVSHAGCSLVWVVSGVSTECRGTPPPIPGSCSGTPSASSSGTSALTSALEVFGNTTITGSGSTTVTLRVGISDIQYNGTNLVLKKPSGGVVQYADGSTIEEVASQGFVNAQLGRALTGDSDTLTTILTNLGTLVSGSPVQAIAATTCGFYTNMTWNGTRCVDNRTTNCTGNNRVNGFNNGAIDCQPVVGLNQSCSGGQLFMGIDAAGTKICRDASGEIGTFVDNRIRAASAATTCSARGATWDGSNTCTWSESQQTGGTCYWTGCGGSCSGGESNFDYCHWAGGSDGCAGTCPSTCGLAWENHQGCRRPTVNWVRDCNCTLNTAGTSCGSSNCGSWR